jgi:hypothetical protein
VAVSGEECDNSHYNRRRKRAGKRTRKHEKENKNEKEGKVKGNDSEKNK